MENWKSVVGYEGYEVSDLGEVRSWRKGNGRGLSTISRMLNPASDTDGYKVFTTYIHGKRIHKVHREVLLAFSGTPPEDDDYICAHNNGNNKDNRLSNLSWKTNQENIDDRTRHGTTARRERSGNAKYGESHILYIREMHNRGMSIGVLSDFLGMPWSTIQCITSYKTWKY